MVSFSGDKAVLYKANFCCRTALRILKPIYKFIAGDADELYEAVKRFNWNEVMKVSQTFSIDTTVFSEEFRHSRFVTYRVKDAIADFFTEQCGERPSIRLNNPDVQFNVHIAGKEVTLSLDSSGEPLYKRGYRVAQTDAPINEVLAAGILKLAGWDGQCNFIDPMCGSGTIAIEAALIAKNMAPGIFRKEFAFEKWADFDADLFDTIYNDDSEEREYNHHIYAYDIDMKAVNTARLNVKAAGLSDVITVEQADFKNFTQPKEKSIMITNPPYGERISTPDLLGTYKMIGERLKHQFLDNDAWVLSYRQECFDQIGLKPSIKYPLYNGSLECELRKYQIFDGRLRNFREEGGIVKTDEEKKSMAEKHRFKKNREFKKRIDENEENEEGDIRTFKFHRYDLDRFDNKRRRNDDDNTSDRRSDRRSDRKNDRKGDWKNDRKGGKGFGKGFGKAGKNFSKGGRNFNNFDDYDE